MPAQNWASKPPNIYDIVTGFFPETSPKETWATDPRPMIVCGRAHDPETGMYFCRVAYGTTRHLNRAHDNDLVIGNLSLMNQLGLKKPTRFVINTGAQMAILPWTEEFFQPWTGRPTPILSTLTEDIQRYVGSVLVDLSDLPQF